MHSIVKITGAVLIVAFGAALGCSSSNQTTAGTGGTGAAPSGGGGGTGLIQNFGGVQTFGGGGGGPAGTGGIPTAGTGGTPTAGTGGITTAGTGGGVTAGTGGGTATVGTCKATGAVCTTSVDCCSLSCVGGMCAPSCTPDATACTDASQCCSGICSSTCQPLTTVGCKSSGNACALDTDCCSGLCKNMVCERASSICVQENDICSSDAQCCTGVCVIASGATTGYCGSPPGNACQEGVNGHVCTDCGECCSRLCAPYAPTGLKICQPPSGCRVFGELCRADSDCCGAPGSGFPGDGTTHCDDVVDGLGRCGNQTSPPSGGGACNPQGNVCHYLNYACNGSSTQNNCCGDINKKQEFCQLDGIGIPRCNGLLTCRAVGETCTNALDCCDPATGKTCCTDPSTQKYCTGGSAAGAGCGKAADCPGGTCDGCTISTTCVDCLPDAMGVLRCGTACADVGNGCTTTGDCCCGQCEIPVGQSQGTCGSCTVQCKAYGQACMMDSDCCDPSPVVCLAGTCRVPPG